MPDNGSLRAGEPILSLNDSSSFSGSLPSSEDTQVEPILATSLDTTASDENSGRTVISSTAVKKRKRKAADVANEMRAKIFELQLQSLEEEQLTRRKREASDLEMRQLEVEVKQQILNLNTKMMKYNAELHEIKMKYYAAKLKSLQWVA